MLSTHSTPSSTATEHWLICHVKGGRGARLVRGVGLERLNDVQRRVKTYFDTCPVRQAHTHHYTEVKS